MKLSIEPFVARVNDYHEFDAIVRHLKLAGIKVRYVELMSQYGYVAVFYSGIFTSQVKEFIERKRVQNEK